MSGAEAAGVTALCGVLWALVLGTSIERGRRYGIRIGEAALVGAILVMSAGIVALMWMR